MMERFKSSTEPLSIMDSPVEASYWSGSNNDSVKCDLCPHNCTIPEGGRGICGVRLNAGGTLTADGYGLYPAIHMDPIEKKPLNHFMPGSSILSLGSVGCNLNCLHCQNWSLARSSSDSVIEDRLGIDDLVRMASSRGSIGVAYTYNEPTINFEFIMDSALPLKESGSKIVLVTNGHLSDKPWKDLMKVTDAANIDVKGFTEKFYRKITGGSLEPVLRNTAHAYREGVHIEIAYLVIPGKNDDDCQIDGFISWVKEELSTDVPVHFNRFHPDHLMRDVIPTPPETLLSIRSSAEKSGLTNVFIGNMGGKGLNDTVCPGCGKILINRDGFFSPKVKLRKGSCPGCGRQIYGKWKM